MNFLGHVLKKGDLENKILAWHIENHGESGYHHECQWMTEHEQRGIVNSKILISS